MDTTLSAIIKLILVTVSIHEGLTEDFDFDAYEAMQPADYNLNKIQFPHIRVHRPPYTPPHNARAVGKLNEHLLNFTSQFSNKTEELDVPLSTNFFLLQSTSNSTQLTIQTKSISNASTTLYIMPSKSPYTTPSKTPYTTPSITSYIIPSKSPYTMPSKTPYTTPSKTPYTTPSITPYTTPSKTPYTTPSITPYTTPSITLYTTPSMTPYTTPSKKPYTTPSITPCTTPSKSPYTMSSKSPYNMSSKTPYTMPYKSPYTSELSPLSYLLKLPTESSSKKSENVTSSATTRVRIRTSTTLPSRAKEIRTESTTWPTEYHQNRYQFPLFLYHNGHITPPPLFPQNDVVAFLEQFRFFPIEFLHEQADELYGKRRLNLEEHLSKRYKAGASGKKPKNYTKKHKLLFDIE